ncbi:MAG: peptide chain release factor N(5)-glutamine methyltransferase [Rhodospirillales bacterium]|nr:peptide chain release factor N(5)-glutamine methyltransferase [Rhodospirillales bacterium]MDH3917237.1 peptide chain release factor N(5)-glutamine methyltransferase [Rhodospirillales bacterium]MDH3965632.1 peptide chain release factor N(5)-glutamine methyltransferase [Rhodospirillales bacterium]
MNAPIRGCQTTIGTALDRAAESLGAAGVEQPRRDARLLLAEALGGGAALITGYPERQLDAAEVDRFAALIRRRSAREPVSRILGRRDFWSLTLRVTPHVLDPRPDSETLVEAVLARIGDRDAALQVLDLGTGSGCLLLALLSELPRARGLGVDISPSALSTARENARVLDLSSRAEFRRGDWARELVGSWQVIVSNPPYIIESAIADLAPEVARYDPNMALSGGADGLVAYRSLVPQAARLLAPGGILALEVGAGQADEVEQLLGGAGLLGLCRARDLTGTDRCVLATNKAGISENTIG